MAGFRQDLRRAAALYLAGLSILCWVFMWLASQDLWHEAGRPAFGQLDFDLRFLIVTFYVLLPLLAGQFAVSVLGLRRPS